MNTEHTIAKLKQIVQSGEGTTRRFQRYSRRASKFVNCLFHAIFNLTNKQIKKLDLDEKDKKLFQGFFKNGDTAQAIADIKNFVEQTGLLFEKCDYDDRMEKGSSKIALYLCDDLWKRDFHLFREEKNSRGNVVWTSKVGFTKKTKKDDFLDMKMDGMTFSGCFKITNPNIKTSSKDKEVGK